MLECSQRPGAAAVPTARHIRLHGDARLAPCRWNRYPRIREYREVADLRIGFNASEANAALARPGMSVETAVAVSTEDNASATERARRIGCAFDPGHDIVERALTKLPEHPGLGRARPQGPTGTQVFPAPAR
jgi:hypothetical protein